MNDMPGESAGGAPSADDVARIAAMRDPVLRNLLITDAYARLAAALRRRGPTCANWCTFATWASRQAGQSIRGEDMVESLRARLRLPARVTHPIHSMWRKVLARGLFNPDTRLGKLVRIVQGPLDPFERASEAVARGNLKVFEEIGDAFARYLVATGPGGGGFDAFARTLTPGDPPNGQRLLRQAFTRYHEAERSPSDPRNALRMFVANVEIGWHEQMRLQPDIQDAMEGPVTEVKQVGLQILGWMAPGSSLWWRWLRTALATVMGGIVWPLAAFWRAIAREVVTDRLMMLRIPPARVLRLGAHLDAPYAASLDQVDDVELTKMLLDWGCLADPHECGADDWADVTQRMHYIAHLFRAFQEDAALATSPFTDAQVAEIASGRIPEGEL